MQRLRKLILSTLILYLALFTQGCSEPVTEIERPEPIRSKRVVVYDQETYNRLAEQWKEYNNVYPSEDAYANWMYAARYAGHKDYKENLEKGVGKYPANPTLLYLSGMVKHGAADYEEGMRKLELAAELDPFFIDPWFSLVVHYMERGDRERMEIALRHLLEAGAIAEEIMDYSFNMLLGLEREAILITNGDNDTYPGWVLNYLLDHRPDVLIVNRSLLNTSWYPIRMIEEGLPVFITKTELEELRETTQPPFSDRLIARLIEAAELENRPVYFSLTLYPSPIIDEYMKKGRMLGLVNLVTPPLQSHAQDLMEVVATWTKEFRTGGMDGWRVRYAKEGDAGRMLMMNYCANIHALLDPLGEHAPGLRVEFFRWYRDHCVNLLSRKDCDEIGEAWSQITDEEEIQAWCREQGYIR